MVNRIAISAAAVILACLASLMPGAAGGYHFGMSNDAVVHAGDAAFRDGMFLGRRDSELGRRPHLASGRWNTEADRRSFVKGYLHAYGDFGSNIAESAAQRGFRDGVMDGLQHRSEARSFQLNSTDNYKAADRGRTDGNDQSYREGYCNGYQQGYYGEAKT